MNIDAIDLLLKLSSLQKEINQRPEGLDKFGSLETLRDVLELVDNMVQEQNEN